MSREGWSLYLLIATYIKEGRYFIPNREENNGNYSARCANNALQFTDKKEK